MEAGDRSWYLDRRSEWESPQPASASLSSLCSRWLRTRQFFPPERKTFHYWGGNRSAQRSHLSEEDGETLPAGKVDRSSQFEV